MSERFPRGHTCREERCGSRSRGRLGEPSDRSGGLTLGRGKGKEGLGGEPFKLNVSSRPGGGQKEESPPGRMCAAVQSWAWRWGKSRVISPLLGLGPLHPGLSRLGGRGRCRAGVPARRTSSQNPPLPARSPANPSCPTSLLGG